MKFDCDCFFDCGLQLTKSKKYVRVFFFCSRMFDNYKTNKTAERVITFGSDIAILCCDCIFCWLDDLIHQELADSVDEIDDCQRVIHINDLLTMNEPPPTRCEQFSSNVIYFDEICDDCKKHYIKKISLKFHRIKTSL